MIKQSLLTCRAFFIITIVMMSTNSFAQGIVFTEGSFEEIVELAKKENKNIFVDAYTTWCAPCKKMTAQTFPDLQVGLFFNKNFVSIKLDAEKESSHGFFSKYKADAFPTLFWLNSDGELMDKQSGFMSPDELLKAAEMALTKNIEANYRALEKRWESGERTNDLFREYVFGDMRTIAPEKIKQHTIDYLSTLTDEQLKSYETYVIVRSFMRQPSNDIIFTTLLNNWDSYLDQEEDKESMWVNMYRTLVRSTSAHLFNKDQEGFEKAYESIASLDFEYIDFYIESLKLEKLIFSHEYEQALNMILSLGDKYFEQHPYMYNQYLYTLVIGDFFVQENTSCSETDKLLLIAKRNAKSKPTQESMLFLAASYAAKGDYKSAYEYLASLGFYPKPMLSNAVYPKLNLPVPRDEYPW